MKDPLPPPPSFVRDATLPLANLLDLRTLPFHIHEVLLSFVLYLSLEFWVAPAVSKWLFPSIYSQLPSRTKINWDVHFVSLVQSTIICSLAFWVVLADEDRRSMRAGERIWGYNGATAMTQAFAAGYFIWDAFVSARNLSILGPGSLAHAVSALVISSLGFRPFANFYGVAFVLYELSTPFLNFHWFFDKCNLTGSRVQLVNGIVLVAAFFGCRLAWGTYQSIKIYMDIFALSTASGDQDAELFSKEQTLKDTYLFDTNQLPWWLVAVYLGSNTLLAVLNFYWFGLMLQAIAKRFPRAKPTKSGTHDKMQ